MRSIAASAATPATAVDVVGPAGSVWWPAGPQGGTATSSTPNAAPLAESSHAALVQQS